MPPNKAPAEPDPNRLSTRAGNAKIHPGTAAQNALRARKPPRDPDIIQKEKADKEAKKMAKQKALEDARAKEESATRFVEEYRARKETEASNEDRAMPRQKPKGKFLNLQLPTYENRHLILFVYSYQGHTPRTSSYQRIGRSQYFRKWS